jgi:1,4-dihydroxy-2-naphthoyl-CoA hydrolase
MSDVVTNDAIALFRARQIGFLPDLLGLEWIEMRHGFVHGRLKIKKHHLAPNGYLHAATVVTLADTACGYGCIMSLPEGIENFTTVELKANFIGTALEGGIACDARLAHGGRTTQVWDAEVKSETSGKTLALFRCTQFLLARSVIKPAATVVAAKHAEP